LTADPFDTASVRSRVLAAWTASPARFREDANAEEDLVLGGYRDRLVIELAQNASDAAVRAGRPGVLRLSIVDGVLLAANTGAPLSADGVQALATLRASAKRGGAAVGRFGVGFAAVLAVCDQPEVVSTTGAVRFSLVETAEAVAAIPALEAEVVRRDGRLPVLRLPWPAAGRPPDGFDTEVRLPLRPGVEPAVRAALAAVPAELLLALPGLTRIELDGRVLSVGDAVPEVASDAGPVRVAAGTALLRDGATTQRWQVARRAGELPAELLADRSVEEREHPQWTLIWAVPVGAGGRPAPLATNGFVHAPTPSAEPLSLPVRLIATFPLDPTRQHVAPGPLTDFLVGQAAAGYADLVAALPAEPAVLSLLPRLALARAQLDAAVCRAVLAELRDRAWLPGPLPPDQQPPGQEPSSQPRPGQQPPDQRPPGRIPPGRATVIDAASPALVEALADVLPGLLPAAWSGRGAAPALDSLGVRRLSIADIVELVAGLDRSPRWWAGLYAALAHADRELLTGLPVPLSDGRLVTGPRGLLLPAGDLPVAGLDALGLRVVDPAARHPLLERLGAVPATARGVLADGRVRAAVESSLDEADPEPVAAAVLGLVRAAGVRPGELPWLAELALPTEDGQWAPAGELLLPGSPLAAVLVADSPFGVLDPGWLARNGEPVLTAAGALRTFAVLRASDVDTAGAEYDLDAEQEYYDAVADRLPGQDVPPRLAELVAVRDLELVSAGAWPRALALLMTEPLRGAIEQPVIAVLADGSRHPVPSYTRWWLASHPVLGGRRPAELRLPASTELAGLYDPADGDPALLRAVGCLSTVDDVLADPALAEDLLVRLGDPARSVDPALLPGVYARLAHALEGYDVEPPDRVRVGPQRTVPAGDAVVLDAPYLLPLLSDDTVVPAGGRPGAVADLLDVPFGSDLVTGRVESEPVRTAAWSAVPGATLAAARCQGAVPAATVAWHEELRVSGRRVPWWPAGEVDHVDAAAGAAALGRALAWRLQRWDRRAAAAEALARPEDTVALRAEDAAEPLPGVP
jgi:hypothetical protein